MVCIWEGSGSQALLPSPPKCPPYRARQVLPIPRWSCALPSPCLATELME